MPNPFALTGFQFLAFYLLLGFIVNWAVRKWIRTREVAASAASGLPAPQLASDPYLVAYLRGGAKEAMRVATIALVDRGLLKAEGNSLKSKNGKVMELVNRPIEKAILGRYMQGGDADAIFADPKATAACEQYKSTLIQHRLIADGDVRFERLTPIVLGVGALALCSFTKVQIAFSQGRHNVGFLIALTLIFSFFVLAVYFKSTTGSGDAMLADLKLLFAKLKSGAKKLSAGGKTNEAALLAAVFGMAALPAAAFPFVNKLYPAQSASTGSSGSDSSSSSCGSSCGGGCGGGGCGG
ncbi:hypothetical protein BH11PSE11_BH11PSE11_10600 [soil metagenome]